MTVSMPNIRVLVVDDEPSLLDDYRYILGNAERSESSATLAELEVDLFGRATARLLPNVELQTFQQGEEAVAAVAAAKREGRPFAVAFIDLLMPPGLHGVETAEKIRASDPDLQIVVVTAYADVHPFEIAGQVPPADRLFFIQKPFNALEIQQFVNALGSKWRAEQVLRQLRRMPARPSDQANGSQTEGDLLPAGMAMFDPDDRLIAANHRLRELYRDAPLAFEPGATYEACLREILRDALDTDGPTSEQSWIADRIDWHRAPTGAIAQHLKNGTTIAVTERRLPDARCVTLHMDVSELQKQWQACAVAGELAAVRAAIGNCAELMSGPLQAMVAALHAAGSRAGSPTGAACAAGLDAAARARRLLDMLGEIGPRRCEDAAVVDLGQVIPSLQQDLERIAGRNVAVEIAAGSAIWPTALDPGRLRDALGELAANARDAMPNGGHLKLRVANMPGSASATGPARDSVVVTVADTGMGMNAEIRARALQPFFTTRRAQGCGGLGLAAVHSFVLQSSGEIEIDSREGAGTSVRLAFPRWRKHKLGETDDGALA